MIWDATYADVDLARLTDFLELKGIRLAGRASGAQPPRVAARQVRAETRRGGSDARRCRRAREPMTRQLPADLIARVDPLPPEQGPFNRQLPLGHVPIAGRIKYALDPEWIEIAQRLDRDREDLRRVPGTHRVGAALDDPVPRDQPRLAGERSRARRDHDRVRRADRRDRDRRPRRVRRDDVRRVLAAAHRGALHRRAHARLGHALGPRRRRPGDREQLRDDHEQRDRARGIAHRLPKAGSRSASRARTAARRSTRRSR